MLNEKFYRQNFLDVTFLYMDSVMSGVWKHRKVLGGFFGHVLKIFCCGFNMFFFFVCHSLFILGAGQILIDV